MVKEIIHGIKLVFPILDSKFTYCGLSKYKVTFSIRNNQVTCKNCLKSIYKELNVRC